MNRDFSNENLQKETLKNADLSYSSFTNCDLRGVDLSGSNLTGSNFTKVKTGITPLNATLLFIFALIISLVSGYFAMRSGIKVQEMLASADTKIRFAGIITSLIIILFILYAWWKGTGKAIMHLIVPVIVLAAIIGLVGYFSGLGTGLGMLYQIIALSWVVVMFIVGTIARVAAGTLSNILFFIVALSGGMFGRSVGGGIGTVIMAIACMQISKRALSGAKGFELLRTVAFYITRKFGTSFRNSNMKNSSFSQSTIHNGDFTNADISTVNWSDSKLVNCMADENGIIIIKNNKHGGGKKS